MPKIKDQSKSDLPGGGKRKMKKKFIVPKWKLFRAKEPLVSVFMWGINHTIRELDHVPPPGLLLPNEFKSYSKIKVRNHLFNEVNMPTHFKIKEYCPNVFRNIRRHFGVDDREYLESLTVVEPEAEEKDGSFSSSASASRLFVSFDNKFVVKLIDSEAVAEIHEMLRKYHEYVVEAGGKTLLPQLLGLYRITIGEDGGHVNYMQVMRNVFGGRYKIHRKYDLKGSTVQRQASEKERAKDVPLLKDNDFLGEDKYKIVVRAEAKQQLVEMLKADTDFLTRLHLMDYSLLVGIHDVELASAQQPGKELQEQEADESAPAPVGIVSIAGSASRQHQQHYFYHSGTISDLDSGGDEPAPLTTTKISGAAPIGIVGGNANTGPGFGALSELEAVEESLLGASPPTNAVAALNLSGMDLHEEFFAIPSSPESQMIYFIGLVDILTYYGVKKKTASAAKTVKYGSEAENISTVRPEQYARRLLDFVQRNVHTSATAGAGNTTATTGTATMPVASACSAGLAPGDGNQ